MMKNIVGLFIALVCSVGALAGERYTFTVSAQDIQNGYVAKRVPLNVYAVPKVVISDVIYTTIPTLPESALPSSVSKYEVLLGKELKKPFASIRVPAYSLADDGKTLRRVTAITIEVTENQSQANNQSSAKTTAVDAPLANGTWYKVAVPATGLYKVDYQFLTQTLGISASSIVPSRIRVFGNGGNMLSEDNTVSRPDNLLENAIYVNDGGDGSFDPGDYFVFYAVGSMGWKANTASGKFDHIKNIYEDNAYYFFNFDQGAGKRVSLQPTQPTGNVTVNSFDYYSVIDNDLENIGSFGKTWFAEEFSSRPGQQLSRSYSMDLGNTIGEALIEIAGGSYNPAGGHTAFSANVNGTIFSLMVSFIGSSDFPLGYGVDTFRKALNGNTNFQLTYTPTNSSTKGFLNYIEVNARKPLAFTGSSLLFRDMRSVGTGNVATYTIGNANANTQVWDVTDPQTAVQMNGSASGSNYTFTQDASVLREFAAFNSDALASPTFISAVPNQNIHGVDVVDYVIVTYPEYKSAADRLAEFHRQRDKLSVLVATTTQVYNEFSSGSQDISAIRDMMRMFYKNAGNDTTKFPKYLLLMGDGSFDYKDRINNNSNRVPTFETEESFRHIDYYACDDFFAFLDDNENIENYGIVNTLDIGVGRIPANSLTEANDVVNKILHYKSPASLGPWRLATTYVADDEDGAGPHMSDGEIMEQTVNERSNNIFNSTKVYLDALPTISTPGGARAPQANKIINDAIFKGTFLVNYSGHGNPQVMAEERILTPDDYNSWKNLDNLPIMITATCDYGQYDQPTFVSSGERLLLKNNGGVIATLTTTQLVYQSYNRPLNRDFLAAQFEHKGGDWYTFGDAIRIGKNKTYINSTSPIELINFRKFVLLGDPALEPNFPEFFVSTDSVLDAKTGKAQDTLGALGAYLIKGSVTDVNGNVLTDFNGNLSVTIFDKPNKRTVNVYPNNFEKSFQLQNNIIYRGKATVSEGKFSFSFVAPKDINYEFGDGKISYYAENGITDAAGVDTSYSIGGYSDNPSVEDNPPVVRPYIGDSLFRNGGLTGANTLLYAILEDETGINVSGNAVGHDLTAVLDDDVSNPYIMNDYYETAPNTFRRGYVSFPVYDIPEGRHRFTVKAWDVNNNSGTGTVDFEVADGGVVKVQQLMNYPNPFSDKTHFVFEHNHPNENLTAEINIYNTSGVLVRKIRQSFVPGVSRSNEITWDGTSDYGALLPSGVYVYRMKIETAKGIEDMAYQKLVIVR